ncbi:hypothetical protein L1049_013324 [Liquidambar formosana]|uniref:PGG domain-containing protein n=1 Tax=Liquidambar formosana TaxID=63359 RepID=A0AAP0RL05_LIQFO
MEIRDVLCEAGVRRAKELIAFPPPSQDIVHRKREVSPKLLVSKLLDYYLSQKGANWLEEIHGTLMVVATVIATMSFQAALNPPGGVWQEDTNKGAKCGNPKCIAGTSILAYTYPQSLDLFYTYNTVSFVSSLTIILLLFSGFPLKNKICMWLLTMTMCTTVTFMALTYLKSLDLVTPDPKMREVDRMYRSTVHIWFGLIVAIALSNAIGFLYWLVKKWQNFRHEMPSGPANERQLLDV